ncbi:hypothetical protein FNO01nite_18290 [Flavobacterium noncentrifugens]|uniref:YdhG-like domain-containing protein n=1 Tax=Flavobacterium noncentrifugens TaxID=1128970 RepID=A0A1G8YBF7_9FLAO|nr:hypothetical protein [Flavobacterium noncentrifugens]GEP51157.1 hypothetical protein FNO01nite_18290 [Flavobacterium noncentrifugens]SDK00026.1 hypothetical protein SAMN04487935_2261 [Flavobacterium noncentrifugens]
MNPDIRAYNGSQAEADKKIFELLCIEIDKALPEAKNKIWHRHPVWFLNSNPVVGSKLKDSVRLIFCSGQTFEENGLHPKRATTQLKKLILKILKTGSSNPATSNGIIRIS